MIIAPVAPIAPIGAESLLRSSSLFSIPHDPASIVVYVLLAISGLAIWYGDRRSKQRSRETDTDERSPSQSTNPDDGMGASGIGEEGEL